MTDIKHSHHYFDTTRNLDVNHKQMDDYLSKVNPDVLKQQPDVVSQPYDKVITLKVSQETFDAWELLCENWGDVIGYDNKSKIFEFAIIEALNVPIASLGGFTM